MEIINYIFPLVYGHIFFCIFKNNDLKINSTKQMVIDAKYKFNQLNNKTLQIQLIDINLQKINQNMRYENRYLPFIIPINTIGILIFYIYFESMVFFLMSTITILIVISYAAVKKNYLKSYFKIKNLI